MAQEKEKSPGQLEPNVYESNDTKSNNEEALIMPAKRNLTSSFFSSNSCEEAAKATVTRPKKR